MPPAKGTEPTKVLRLPVWLIDYLTPYAEAAGVTVPGYITQKMAPREPVVHGQPVTIARCTCKTPTISKHVSNLCTTCHRLR